MVTLSLAETEDKVLALFSAGGLVVFLEQYLQGQTDPHYQAVGALLVAVGVFLKAVIVSSPPAATPK